MKLILRLTLFVALASALVFGIVAQDDMAEEVVGTFVQQSASAALSAESLVMSGVAPSTPAIYLLEDGPSYSQISTLALEGSMSLYATVSEDGEALMVDAVLESPLFQAELVLTPVVGYIPEEGILSYTVVEIVAAYDYTEQVEMDKFDLLFEAPLTDATLYLLGTDAFLNQLEEGYGAYLAELRPSGTTPPCIRGRTC